MHFDSAMRRAEWLQDNLTLDKLVILDASIQPVGASNERYPPQAFIPGALAFDIDTVFSDTDSPLPHTMLNAEAFRHQVRQLGINNDSLIVVYDCFGLYSAARAWWMFRAMGHHNVYVLDGGLPYWLAQGYPVAESLSGSETIGEWRESWQPGSFCQADEVLAAIKQPGSHIIDGRPSGRFLGVEPEPRPGLRPGHIPGSVNIPFSSLLENDLLKSESQLRQLFQQLHFAIDDRLIFSCGSAVTACVPLLAAYIAGYANLGLYDGSWSEWGKDEGYPLEC